MISFTHFRLHINGKSGLEIHKVTPFRAGRFSCFDFKFSDSHIRSNSDSQILRFSDCVNLRLSDFQRFPDSQTFRPHNLDSQLLILPSQTLRPDSQTLRLSDSQTRRLLDSQTLRVSDAQTFRLPGAQTLRTSESQTLRAVI